MEWQQRDKEQQMEGKVSIKTKRYTSAQNILGRIRKPLFVENGKERTGRYEAPGRVLMGPNAVRGLIFQAAAPTYICIVSFTLSIPQFFSVSDS